MNLPDPVPLGVSGTVTVPRARYEATAARDRPVDILPDERARVAYVARRLDDAFGRPLILPGSEALARAMLGLFPDPQFVLAAFAEKAVETLRDGVRHDRMVLSPDDPPAVIWFHAWNGTHREVQPSRYGTYLNDFVGGAFRLVELRGPLAGFLQIDAYVREDIDPEHPARNLAEIFEIDVEFSFLPGFFLRYPQGASNPLPDVLLLNRGLCSAEELQALDTAVAGRAPRAPTPTPPRPPPRPRGRTSRV